MATKIAIVSTVKAPISELKIFVEHHCKIGIDHIILFFDDPEDDAFDYFANYGNVVAIACDEHYWVETASNRPVNIEGRQVLNANKGFIIAKENSCDWIIHIDSDELIYPTNRLHDLLNNCNADLLKFEVLEAVSEKKEYEHIFVPSLFKRTPNQFQIKLAQLFGCRSAIYNGEFFRGHLASKVAVKISENILSLGIHGPKFSSGDVILKSTRRIKLLHYDCIGFEAWKRKWSRRFDGTATASEMRENRQQQFDEFRSALEEGDEALSVLYQKMQVIPKKERAVLHKLNMLIRLDINLTAD